MALRLEELAKTIDHALPGADPAPEAVIGHCEEACEHHFAAVCVAAGCVGLAADRLRGRGVKAAAVVAGRDRRENVALATSCVAAGAAEIEVRLNTKAMVNGSFRAARDDLAAVVRVVRMAGVNTGRGSALVKVSVDCDLLDTARKRLACLIVADVDADFADARTAAAGTSALYDLELLRENLPERIALKATVPVETPGEAHELITAGAARIGTPHAVTLFAGARALSGLARA